MDAVKRAKQRFRKYPSLVLECRESASEYAACVINKNNLQKDDCQKEFEKFKACLVRAAAHNKVKL